MIGDVTGAVDFLNSESVSENESSLEEGIINKNALNKFDDFFKHKMQGL